MKKVFIIGGSVLVVFVLGFFLLRLTGGKPYEATLPLQDKAVQAVYATGTVEATVMMPISPRVSARLMKLEVDEGSEVQKDQVLARLEDTDIRQSLNELRARQELAKVNFERAQSLIDKNAISKGEYDTTKSNLDAAKALVAASEAQLSYMTLIAPEKGRIIRRDGEIGQMIAVNQAVFWMSCCAPLRISTEVDEEDIALVEPGQKVLIRADAFPGQVFDGVVQSITPKGDPVARSYRVRVGFTGETPLLIGMTAETNIIIRESNSALTIPTNAIQQNKVWLVKDGRAVHQKIKTGAAGLGSTEIIEGINAEDIIITKPDIQLEEGMKIRAKIIKSVKQ